MKGLFNIFIGKKRLFLFTERLSELISSGCPLQKSLYIISRLNSRDLKINQTASFLHKAILSGTKFSVAISLAPFIKVPEWYASFILASEECGSLPGILDYLKKMLGHEKMAGEKFFSALAYPLLVIILASAAGFFSVFFFIPAFQGFLGGEAEVIKSNAVKTMLYGDIFLMLVFFLLAFFMKRLISVSPLINVFRTVSFLSGKSVPIFQSLCCSFAFSNKNRKLSSALLEVKNRLLQGENVAACFGKCFVESGFKNEGLLLSENLSLCEQTGKSDGFLKTAEYLAEKNVRLERVFLSLLQPFLLFIAAIYIALILKTAIMPFIINFGGLI